MGSTCVCVRLLRTYLLCCCQLGFRFLVKRSFSRPRLGPASLSFYLSAAYVVKDPLRQKTDSLRIHVEATEGFESTSCGAKRFDHRKSHEIRHGMTSHLEDLESRHKPAPSAKLTRLSSCKIFQPLNKPYRIPLSHRLLSCIGWPLGHTTIEVAHCC